MRRILLFAMFFLPGLALIVLLSGELHSPDQATTPRPAATPSSPEIEPGSANVSPERVVAIGDAISVVEPEVFDFVFPVHDELMLPSGKVFAKTGELQGRRMDFADYGLSVNVAEPVLLLYRRVVVPEDAGADWEAPLELLARAHAEEALLNRGNKTVVLSGNVVLIHLLDDEESGRLETETLHCLLDEQVLVTNDAVRLVYSPRSGQTPDLSGEEAPQLLVTGRGLNARPQEGKFQILAEPRVTFRGADQNRPLVLQATGSLYLTDRRDSGQTSASDSGDPEDLVATAEISLQENVEVELPTSLGRSTGGDETALITADYLWMDLHELRPSASGRTSALGRSLRNLDAQGHVTITAPDHRLEAHQVSLRRKEDGTFSLLASGNPRMEIVPPPGLEEGKGSAEPSPGFRLRASRTILLRGHEEEAGDGVEAFTVFESLVLDGEARVSQLPPGLAPGQTSDGTPSRTALEGDRIEATLDRGERGEIRLRHLVSDGSARLVQNETLVEGVRIEATSLESPVAVADDGESEPPPRVARPDFGRVLVTGPLVFRTTVETRSLVARNVSRPTDATDRDVAAPKTLLTVTCQGSGRLDPPPRPGAPREVHLEGPVSIKNEGAENGEMETLEASKSVSLSILPGKDPAQAAPRERGSASIRRFVARGRVHATGRGLDVRADLLETFPADEKLHLEGDPAVVVEIDASGIETRRIAAPWLLLDGATDRMEARDGVRLHARMKGDPARESNELGTGSPSLLEVDATELTVTLFPRGDAREREIRTFSARGPVEGRRWEGEEKNGPPALLHSQLLDYDSATSTLELQGDEEAPARILVPSTLDPTLQNELAGPTILFMTGRENEPDEVRVPKSGSLAIFSSAGQSFYATDLVDPRSEEMLDVDPELEASETDPEKTITAKGPPTLTRIACRGPMVLRRGETVSFEDGVHIQRFEPLDVLKAETRCSLLTLYLEPESDPASKDHRSLLEKVSRVVALGEVTFSGEGRQGSCARLTFHPETRVLTLRGDEAPARLRIVLGDGRVLIRNARCIEYNLETDHLRAYELDTRVRQGDG